MPSWGTQNGPQSGRNQNRLQSPEREESKQATVPRAGGIKTGYSPQSGRNQNRLQSPEREESKQATVPRAGRSLVNVGP